ncbi:MAG TPA: hypothetical protein VFQ54_03295, partial [Thermomicrobiales bacterium]|nr:hypothetical protein [Thermomicrobiales bacterium]
MSDEKGLEQQPGSAPLFSAGMCRVFHHTISSHKSQQPYNMPVRRCHPMNAIIVQNRFRGEVC